MFNLSFGNKLNFIFVTDDPCLVIQVVLSARKASVDVKISCLSLRVAPIHVDKNTKIQNTECKNTKYKCILCIYVDVKGRCPDRDSPQSLWIKPSSWLLTVPLVHTDKPANARYAAY